MNAGKAVTREGRLVMPIASHAIMMTGRRGYGCGGLFFQNEVSIPPLILESVPALLLEGLSEVLLEGIWVVSWEKILLSIFQIL